MWVEEWARVGRSIFPAVLREYDCAYGILLGAETGEFATQLMSNGVKGLVIVDDGDVMQFETCLERLKEYPDVEFMRMSPLDAMAKLKKRAPWDFIYLNSATPEQLDGYWPLIANGGIMAGRDYQTQQELISKRAKVHKFFGSLPIYLTNEEQPSWLVCKP